MEKLVAQAAMQALVETLAKVEKVAQMGAGARAETQLRKPQAPVPFHRVALKMIILTEVPLLVS